MIAFRRYYPHLTFGAAATMLATWIAVPLVKVVWPDINVEGDVVEGVAFPDVTVVREAPDTAYTVLALVMVLATLATGAAAVLWTASTTPRTSPRRGTHALVFGLVVFPVAGIATIPALWWLPGFIGIGPLVLAIAGLVALIVGACQKLLGPPAEPPLAPRSNS